MRKSRLAAALIGAVLFAALGLGIAPSAEAQPVTLSLVRTTGLTNIDDSAGTYQYDGGDVTFGNTLIGHYARVKRVVSGATSAQNTAMLTITIFFLGADPPNTITLQGSHSFNNGQERGSISGSSFPGAVGITFDGPSTALTFHP